MQPRFCSYCGAALPVEAAFCPACRHPVAPQPAVHYYVKQKVPGRGLGISSMVLGIVGVVYTCVMLIKILRTSTFNEMLKIAEFSVVLVALPILAKVFGYAARTRGYKNGISTAGLCMGCIGLILTFLSFIVFSARIL